MTLKVGLVNNRVSDIDPFISLADRTIGLEKEARAIKGASVQAYIFSHEAKEIRIYPEGTAPQLEDREDGVLYFCETAEDTDIDPMKILMGRGIEVVPNDVSYGKMPLNEGSWGKWELFAPRKREEEEVDALVLVCNIPSANYALDLSPWLSAAPGDGTTDISIDWGDNVSAVSYALNSLERPSVSKKFEVYTVEECEDEPVIEEDERFIEGENQIATLATEYPVTETPGTGTIAHTYATAGEYRITLKGSFKWGLGKSTSNTSLQATLTSIELPSGNSPIKHVATYAFYYCTALTSIPEGLFANCTAVTNFSCCFYYCTALTSIPEGLFANCTAVTNFSYCFQSCSAITSIPECLFDKCTAVTDFSYCFQYCSAITSIPQGLFDKCTAVTNFRQCFRNCYALASIPQGLFDKCTAVTNFRSCFDNCRAITSIPAGLFDNCTAVTDFSYCFENCTALTSIPAGLFDKCTKVKDFSYCFYYCNKLTSIPQGLFDKCTAVTSFSYCFYYCTALTSIPQGLFDKCTAVTSFSYCFYYCTALTSIPEGLFAKCTAVTNFSYCFQSCSAITSALPTLWISHPSTSHSGCFRNCTKATNYAAAQAAGWT